MLYGDPAQGQWYTPPSPPFSRHVFQEMFIFMQDTFVPYVRSFIQRFYIQQTLELDLRHFWGDLSGHGCTGGCHLVCETVHVFLRRG